ncbi:MAG TPA: hypothetical protein VK184_13995 [Nostocaceae cyanobacterium]|nr:hypothetical protein [Nostocaceae cyanobacterium]
MLGQNFKSRLFIDLTTKEQQLVAGGQTVPTPPLPPSWNSMGSVLPSILGQGFPNISTNPLQGAGGLGQVEEIINTHENNSGTILYS